MVSPASVDELSVPKLTVGVPATLFKVKPVVGTKPVVTVSVGTAGSMPPVGFPCAEVVFDIAVVGSAASDILSTSNWLRT